MEIASGAAVAKTKCFAAGTPVAMCDGELKPIEQIDPGELVVARDPDTGETACREVLRTSERAASDLIDVKLVSSEGLTETIRVTPEHLFAVEGAEWKAAVSLGANDAVATQSGATLSAVSGGSLRAEEAVYNLEVEQFHTYFVGGVRAWVHNTYPPGKPAVTASTTGSGIAKPAVADSKLDNLVRDLYKGTRAKRPIGTGSTADAIRHETATGLPVGGKFHSQKGQDYARALEKWIDKHPNASEADRTAAQGMLDDLRAALAGK